jgi:hypothetical protein
MTDVLRVNNTILSWNSTICNIASAPFNGLLSIDYGHERKRKKVWGSRRDGRALGRTAGKYEPQEVSIKMLADSWDVLSTILTAIGLGSYGDAEFPFFLQSAEPGIPLAGSNPTLTVVMTDCCITSVHDGSAEGIDEKVKDITIDTMQLFENGKILNSLIRAVP